MMEKDQFKTKHFLASLLVLGFIIGTYFAYCKPLHNKSINTIKQFQTSKPSDTLQGGWTFFARLSLFSLQTGPMILILANSRDRVNAFYFVIVYISAVWLNSMLSLILHDPAPFWIEDDIAVHKCRPGYPNPGS